MLLLILKLLGVIFAVYGFFCMLFLILGSIKRTLGREKYKTGLILVVKDQQETVEGIIRTVFDEDIPSRVLAPEHVIVIDAGSTDKTPDILHRLQTHYPGLDIITKNNV